MIDGVSVTGWFTEDFTLAELRTLRAKERLPLTRPANTAFDGLYLVPTLDEVIDLARHSVSCDGRQVGVYPETKHPTYFDSIGLSLEEPLVAALQANGVDRADAPVIVQSFEVGNLRELDGMTDVTIAQLVSSSGRPYDFVAAGDPRTYADLVTPAGLAEIAALRRRRRPREVGHDPADRGGQPRRRRRRSSPTRTRPGSTVHGWTFRLENQFLPVEFRSSSDPNAPGDLAGEIEVFLEAGMDGFFSDQPDVAVTAG